MNSVHQMHTITKDVFDSLLRRYANVVPSKLKELDTIRYSTIPDSNPSHLSHEQVLQLVDWKLSHGTFRPKLKQLVESNSAQLIEQTTKSAFSSFDGTADKAASSLKELTVLKGIGPATASLLLSVYDAERAPFFSDELFRWCLWKTGKGTGWDRPIKYTPKEYAQLFAEVATLRQRIGVSAVDAERVAYVLGKTAKEKTAEEPKDNLAGVKRKARDEASAVEKSGAIAKKAKTEKVKQPARPAAKAMTKPMRSSARIKSSGK